MHSSFEGFIGPEKCSKQYVLPFLPSKALCRHKCSRQRLACATSCKTRSSGLFECHRPHPVTRSGITQKMQKISLFGLPLTVIFLRSLTDRQGFLTVDSFWFNWGNFAFYLGQNFAVYSKITCKLPGLLKRIATKFA